MSFAVWQRTIVDEEGNVVPGATITVRQEVAGSPLAVLKADREGVDNKANPFTADGDGFAQFFAAGGAYRITATSGAFTMTWRYEAVGTSAETDAGLVSAATPAQWTFNSLTTAVDPGDMMFKLNNADPASATALYIDNLQFTADEVGVDATTWLDTWDDNGVAGVRGVLEIFDAATPTLVFHRYRVSGSVVDSTGFRTITLTHLSGTGSLVEGAEYSFVFWAAGAQGISSGSLWGAGQTLTLSAASTNLTSADSGKAILNSGTNRNVNLPAASAGLNFSFYTLTNTLTVNTVGSEVIVFEDGTSAASLTLTTNQRFILVCDGTNWLAYAGNVRTAFLAQGVHTIGIPAGAMYTPSTAGAAAAVTELVASAPIMALRTLAFDPGTEEAAFFMIPLPKSWNGSTFTMEYLWTATGGAGSVVWSTALRVFSESDALEQAFGTQVDVTDTLTTAGDLHVSSVSAAMTPAGTPADDSVLIGRVSREAAQAGDTLTTDALLLGVRLFITLDASTDA